MDLIPESPGPIQSDPPAFTDERATQLRTGFSLLSPTDLATLLAVDERTLAVWLPKART